MLWEALIVRGNSLTGKYSPRAAAAAKTP